MPNLDVRNNQCKWLVLYERIKIHMLLNKNGEGRANKVREQALPRLGVDADTALRLAGDPVAKTVSVVLGCLWERLTRCGPRIGLFPVLCSL